MWELLGEIHVIMKGLYRGWIRWSKCSFQGEDASSEERASMVMRLLRMVQQAVQTRRRISVCFAWCIPKSGLSIRAFTRCFVTTPHRAGMRARTNAHMRKYTKAKTHMHAHALTHMHMLYV